MPSDPIEWRHKPSTTLDIQLLAEGPQPPFVCGTTLLRCGVEVIYCWIKTQVTQVTSWYRWMKNKQTNKKTHHKTIQEQWLIFFLKVNLVHSVLKIRLQYWIHTRVTKIVCMCVGEIISPPPQSFA